MNDGIGTFETCRRMVTMSVYRGIVLGTRPNRRELTQTV